MIIIQQKYLRTKNSMMHGHGKMGAAPASDAALVPRLSFFFFTGTRQLSSDLRQLGFNSHQTGPIRPKSARISWQPKQAKIGLESCWNSWNRLWIRPKHPKSVLPQFYSEYLLLLLCFLFCFVFLAFFFLCFVNQGHIMCFLRIF